MMTLGAALVLIALGFALYKVPALRKIAVWLLALTVVAALFLILRDRAQAQKQQELAAQKDEVERAFYFSQKLFPGRTVTLQMEWTAQDTPPPPGIHRFDWDPARHWGRYSINGSTCEVTEYAPVSDVEGKPRQTATEVGRGLACVAYDRCFGSGDKTLIEPCKEAVAAGRDFNEISAAQKAAAEELRRAQEAEALRKAREAEELRNAEAESKRRKALEVEERSRAQASRKADAQTLLQQGKVEGAARAFAGILRTEPAGHYTIQTAVACAQETVQKIASSVPGADLFILPVALDGRRCYRVCWGVYDSYEGAQLEMLVLPAYFWQSGVRPRVTPLGEALP